MKQLVVDGYEVSFSGRLCRIARLTNEGYDFVSDPDRLIRSLAAIPEKTDILTFTQGIGDPEPKFSYHLEWDKLAVLPIDTYEQWWKKQINDKTRNMVRKAQKKGVKLEPFELDDRYVRDIKAIYDESPVRQGRPFKHYGKDLETLKRIHATYPDRSEFIGAFLDGQLIGFIKLVHQPGWSSMMQIISLIAHRDKAPTNALIGRAVEICAERRIPNLQYGIWSRRGIGEFKLHHGFKPFDTPRYYVPLSLVGSLTLRTGLHLPPVSRIPEPWLDRIAILRTQLNSYRFGAMDSKTAKQTENLK